LTNKETHDANSHGADAFRYLSTSWRELPTALEPGKQTLVLQEGGTWAVDERGIAVPADGSKDRLDQLIRERIEAAEEARVRRRA
jgi:hypothetical protein